MDQVTIDLAGEVLGAGQDGDGVMAHQANGSSNLGTTQNQMIAVAVEMMAAVTMAGTEMAGTEMVMRKMTPRGALLIHGTSLIG